MRRFGIIGGVLCILLVTLGCSGGRKKAVGAPAQVAGDFEFEEARKKLAAGPVDEYQAWKWMVKARESLDSQGDPWDFRGDYPAAL